MFRKHRRHGFESATLSSFNNLSLRATFSLTRTISRTRTRTASNDDTGRTDRATEPLGLVLLHAPETQKMDFIFVHGLGGGSRKTWSKSDSPAHYWPKEWLPKDPAFEFVRIHSYGYDSNYLKGSEDCLNIHHIGKSFLGEISTSPCFLDSETPIVVVGHSMGGLVIKKAWILANQDSAHATLAKRFAAFCFLATPHRGADWARVLKNILRVAYDRAYVTDLLPNSGALQVINDEFRHIPTDIDLWSFYETHQMKFLRSLIVDPESATLGYREEKQLPMNADHRSICKFDTPLDPNYTILRNALASIVNKFSKVITRPALKEERDRMRLLQKYLGVPELFDDDFLKNKDARLQGSCKWLETKGAYNRWRNEESEESMILWINGKPTTGKSVLAGYVIQTLQDAGLGCSYFIFKHGDKSKSRLSDGLRSLAFQMATLNPEVRDILFEIQDGGSQLDLGDERALWRILFVPRILQATRPRQYWVIDGLDECVNPDFFLDTILTRLAEFPQVRLLMTSRDTDEIWKKMNSLGDAHLQSISISVKDTLPDIQRLIEARAVALEISKEKDRQMVVEEMLKKARGSFLWTILVLHELQSSHSKNEMTMVLDDVPRGMEPLYKRTLDIMSQRPRGKQLAKGIIRWVTCALRPMTSSELDGALRIDIEDDLLALKESINTLCGQIVIVDKSGKVQMVHETARRFLLGEKLDSEFAVDSIAAHTRMAETCLKYLIGDEMKPPRTHRYRDAARNPRKRTDFSAYASIAFSYHLSKSSPSEPGLLPLLERFLKLNILSWIAMIAASHDITQLIITSENIRRYLDACSIEDSSLEPRIRATKGWAMDLVRITAKFGDALVAFPAAIYSMIPPFCPRDSMIHRSACQGKRLRVVGVPGKDWDDRLFCIDIDPRRVHPSLLCYGERYLAITLGKGAIALYDTTSYQAYRTLDHGEPVSLIQFKDGSSIMATCGPSTLKVWDTMTGTIIHEFSAPQRPMDMAFHRNKLMVASQNNYLACWDLEQGAHRQPDRHWNDQPRPVTTRLRRAPGALSLSLTHRMMAVAYSWRPIILWDLEEDEYFGTCGKKLSSGATSTHVVSALAFNPNPNMELLAASYSDGDLAILDYLADEVIACFRANCQVLAASPNGRLLAGGAGNGTVRVFEFATLRMLYSVKASNLFIRRMCFSMDSRHLADIRGSQCTVWEPPLLRDSVDGDNSGTTSAPVTSTIVSDAGSRITGMVKLPQLDSVVCGKDDGTVVLYSLRTGESTQTLYAHKSTVRLLAWWQRGNAVLSIDASNLVMAYCLKQVPGTAGLSIGTALFQSRLDSRQAIMDVLVGEEAGKLILATRGSDYLWSMSGQQEAVRDHPEEAGVRRWVPHPGSPSHMICVDRSTLRVYSWADLSEVRAVPLELSAIVPLSAPKSVRLYQASRPNSILLELSETYGSNKTTGLAVLEMEPVGAQGVGYGSTQSGTSVSTAGSDEENPGGPGMKSHQDILEALDKKVAHVIGILNNARLVFLDSSSWVCSASLEQVASASAAAGVSVEYVRHFFVPYDWFAGNHDIICDVAGSDVVFVRGGEIGVVKGGFDYAARYV